MNEQPQLRQVLSGWQIFFIVFTVVIGSGGFVNFGDVAADLGAIGLILAILVVGIVAIFEMEGLSELVQLFPTVNPIVELVHEFVDPDLAQVVGIFYWFAYSSICSFQLIRAAGYMGLYVDSDQGGWLVAKIAIFWIIVYEAVTLINCMNVRIFGMIESIGGIIKLAMILAILLILFYIIGATGTVNSFNVDLSSSLKDSNIPGSAMCLAIESVAFSFLGIESFATAAYEAKDSVDLRVPSKTLSYAVFWSYLLLGIATGLCSNWQSNDQVQGLDILFNDSRPLGSIGGQTATLSALVYAALNAKLTAVAQTINGMFIFSAITCANSTIFVASRMLFGIANAQEGPSWIEGIAHTNENGVPCRSVLLTAGCFFWLPFTQVISNEHTSHLLTWILYSACISIFFMWAAVSIAYLRYWFFFLPNYKETDLAPAIFARKDFNTFLAAGQPYLAIIGLIGSILIVWVFPSAMFWGRPFTAQQFFTIYTMPILIPLVFVVKKLRKCLLHFKEGGSIEGLIDGVEQWWNHFEDAEEAKKTRDNLTEFLKPSQRSQAESPGVPARADT